MGTGSWLAPHGEEVVAALEGGGVPLVLAGDFEQAEFDAGDAGDVVDVECVGPSERRTSRSIVGGSLV